MELNLIKYQQKNKNSVDYIQLYNIQRKRQKKGLMQYFIFSIDIKIGEKTVKIDIQNKDTIQNIVNKLQEQLQTQLNSNIYRQQIVKYLQQTKLNEKTSNELRQKIQYFLKQNTKTKTQQSFKEDQQTKQNSCINFDKNQTSNNKQRKKIHTNKVNNQIFQQTQTKNILKSNLLTTEKKKIKQKQPNIGKLQKKHNETHKTKTVDEDLVKAYEVIYKKCKDKQMRQIAQNTLKKLGKLKNDIKVKQINIPTNTTIIYNANLNQEIQDFQKTQNCQQVEVTNSWLKKINNQNEVQQRFEKDQKQKQKQVKKRIYNSSVKKYQYSSFQNQEKRTKLIYSYGVDPILQNQGLNMQTRKPNKFKYL